MIYYHERRFLNNLENDTRFESIVAGVKSYNPKHDIIGQEGKEYFDSYLEISDGSKSIYFDLSVDESEEEYLNSIKKLSLLLEVIAKTQEAMMTARSNYLDQNDNNTNTRNTGDSDIRDNTGNDI